MLIEIKEIRHFLCAVCSCLVMYCVGALDS